MSVCNITKSYCDMIVTTEPLIGEKVVPSAMIGATDHAEWLGAQNY